MFEKTFSSFLQTIPHCVTPSPLTDELRTSLTTYLELIRCCSDKWKLSMLENLTVSPCHCGKVIKLTHLSIFIVNYWKSFSLLNFSESPSAMTSPGRTTYCTKLASKESRSQGILCWSRYLHEKLEILTVYKTCVWSSISVIPHYIRRAM